jgi:hypothetical protein
MLPLQLGHNLEIHNVDANDAKGVASTNFAVDTIVMWYTINSMEYLPT